jgi:hypothetical protein
VVRGVPWISRIIVAVFYIYVFGIIIAAFCKHFFV